MRIANVAEAAMLCANTTLGDAVAERKRVIEMGPTTPREYNIGAYWAAGHVNVARGVGSGVVAIEYHYTANTKGNSDADVRHCVATLLRQKTLWSATFWASAIEAWFADMAVRQLTSLEPTTASIYNAVLEAVRAENEQLKQRLERGFTRVLAVGPWPLLRVENTLVTVVIRFHCAGRPDYKSAVDEPVARARETHNSGVHIGPGRALDAHNAVCALREAPWTCAGGERLLLTLKGSHTFDSVWELDVALQRVTNILKTSPTIQQVVDNKHVKAALDLNQKHGIPVWAVPMAKKPSKNNSGIALRCLACDAYHAQQQSLFQNEADHHKFNGEHPTASRALSTLVLREIARDKHLHNALPGERAHDWP